MENLLIIILILMLICLVLLGLFFFNLPPFAKKQSSVSLSQPFSDSYVNKFIPKGEHLREEALDEVAKFSEKSSKNVGNPLTIQKKLRYAQWKMNSKTFHMFEIAISAVCFSIAIIFFSFIFIGLSLFVGPVIMRTLLKRGVDKRSRAFDEDYSPFLMSTVSMLKTGMNTLQALSSSAEGLSPESLVKFEVDFMVERLRFGVSEDLSIGAFGENIYNPEIELFVQTLLLGRNVGGTFSTTLDRLAKQARRRSYFKAKAKSSIGMQRGSVWLIILIMIALELYMFVKNPDFILTAIREAWLVWEVGIAMICFAVFLVYKMTDMKV